MSGCSSRGVTRTGQCKFGRALNPAHSLGRDHSRPNSDGPVCFIEVLWKLMRRIVHTQQFLCGQIVSRRNITNGLQTIC